MKSDNKIEKIVFNVLGNYVGSQMNLDSNATRDMIAKHIAAEVEYELAEYKSLESSHVDGCGYDD